MIIFSIVHKKYINKIIESNNLYKTWDINNFIEGFQIKIISKTKISIQLEIIGIDATIINSLRRILIAESSSFAFEDVYIFNNSSILNDNMIAQRIGLIPVKSDPRNMKFKKENSSGNQFNTFVYILKTTNLSIDNYFFYTDKLKVSKSGSIIPFQSKTYYTNTQKVAIKITHLDLLVTKLKPRQKIFLELHAVKGYGLIHNKFSPITTAWFGYYSSIFFIKNLNYLKKNALIYKKRLFLKKKFEKTKIQKFSTSLFHSSYFINLMKISNIFKINQKNSNIKRKNHFIYNIETIGTIRPEYLFLESIFTLYKKVHRILLLI